MRGSPSSYSSSFNLFDFSGSPTRISMSLNMSSNSSSSDISSISSSERFRSWCSFRACRSALLKRRMLRSSTPAISVAPNFCSAAARISSREMLFLAIVRASLLADYADFMRTGERRSDRNLRRLKEVPGPRASANPGARGIGWSLRTQGSLRFMDRDDAERPGVGAVGDRGHLNRQGADRVGALDGHVIAPVQLSLRGVDAQGALLRVLQDDQQGRRGRGRGRIDTQQGAVFVHVDHVLAEVQLQALRVPLLQIEGEGLRAGGARHLQLRGLQGAEDGLLPTLGGPGQDVLE